jgi:hypothetical protein
MAKVLEVVIDGFGYDPELEIENLGTGPGQVPNFFPIFHQIIQKVVAKK